MSVAQRLRRWRDWFPIPQQGGDVAPVRWILLEGNRMAVTGALITFVFASIMLISTAWTFQMQKIITETPAIQTLLDTLLSGMILLVSIVVSINSVVLSHDITSVGTQEDRLDAAMNFRQEIGRLTETGQSPTDPASFLKLMGGVIAHRAHAVQETIDDADNEHSREIQAFVDDVIETTSSVNDSITGNVTGAEFGVLWLGLEVKYGNYTDRLRVIQNTYDGSMSEAAKDRLEELNHAFRLFATGKEYFKTLYYSQEISRLSRTLLVVTLPAILINATAILAINARILPEFWILGLPPTLTFVAAVFTISLIPYIVLTAYMLRLATVAKRTSTAGPFSLVS